MICTPTFCWRTNSIGFKFLANCCVKSIQSSKLRINVTIVECIQFHSEIDSRKRKQKSENKFQVSHSTCDGKKLRNALSTFYNCLCMGIFNVGIRRWCIYPWFHKYSQQNNQQDTIDFISSETVPKMVKNTDKFRYQIDSMRLYN